MQNFYKTDIRKKIQNFCVFIQVNSLPALAFTKISRKCPSVIILLIITNTFVMLFEPRPNFIVNFIKNKCFVNVVYYYYPIRKLQRFVKKEIFWCNSLYMNKSVQVLLLGRLPCHFFFEFLESACWIVYSYRKKCAEQKILNKLFPKVCRSYSN